jgi:pheromone shutdown protein TraB
MIILLGTSHVSKQSGKDVKEAIAHADIIALELDAARAEGLLSKKQATFTELRKALGLKSAIITTILRSLQQRIGKSVGVEPGVEMLAALKEASRQQKHVALIDRDIRVTMQRLSASFGWPEIRQMSKDFFRRREIPVHPDDDLVDELIGEMRKSYPRIYKAMVAERDVHMARILVHIAEQNPEKTILAVVGKGHVPGMRHQINYIKPQLPVVVWPSLVKNSAQS